MGYDEKSVSICAAFEYAFENVFENVQNVILVSLSDVEVGVDGVHITENGNLQVVNKLCNKMGIENVYPSVPQTVLEASKCCMSSKSMPWTTPDALLMGEKDGLVPYESLRNAGINIVDHRGDYDDNTLMTHFHAVFSQHSPRWLFLYGLQEPDRFIEAALEMVDEHYRHRHVAFVREEFPCNQKEGIRIVSDKEIKVKPVNHELEHKLLNSTVDTVEEHLQKEDLTTRTTRKRRSGG